MDHTKHLRELEGKLKELLEKYPAVDEGLEKFNRIAREKREITERLVLWHAIHGSRRFDVDKL